MHLSIKPSTGEILLDELQTVASQTLQLSMLPQSIGKPIETSRETIGKRTYTPFYGDLDLNGQKVESVIVEFVNAQCSGCYIHLCADTGSTVEKMLDSLAHGATGKVTEGKQKSVRRCYEWGTVAIKEDRHYDALSLEIAYKKI